MGLFLWADTVKGQFLNKGKIMPPVQLQNEHVSKFVFSSLINEAHLRDVHRWFKGDVQQHTLSEMLGLICK